MRNMFDVEKIFSQFDSEAFEGFITEWCNGYLRRSIYKVERFGGPGDKGRDIVVYINEDKSIQDYYQCKCYKSGNLEPNHIYIELGKLCYYTYNSEIIIPRKYYFIAPRVGNDLKTLLDNPEKLKTLLIKNWNKYCKTKIIPRKKIELEGDFKKYVESFDFNIFDSIPALTIIEQHKKTGWYAQRFGLSENPLVIPYDEYFKKEATNLYPNNLENIKQFDNATNKVKELINNSNKNILVIHGKKGFGKTHFLKQVTINMDKLFGREWLICGVSSFMSLDHSYDSEIYIKANKYIFLIDDGEEMLSNSVVKNNIESLIKYSKTAFKRVKLIICMTTDALTSMEKIIDTSKLDSEPEYIEIVDWDDNELYLLHN